MLSLASPITRRIGRWAMTRGMSRVTDLSRVPFVPKSFTMPFMRDGLDLVQRLGARRESAPVSKLTRLFGMNIWLVTGYTQARSVLADPTSAFSNDIRPLIASAGSTEVHSVGGLGLTEPHPAARRADP